MSGSSESQIDWPGIYDRLTADRLDQDAFRTIWEWAYLMASTSRWRIDPDLAPDVAQETCMAVLRGFETGPRPAATNSPAEATEPSSGSAERGASPSPTGPRSRDTFVGYVFNNCFRSTRQRFVRAMEKAKQDTLDPDRIADLQDTPLEPDGPYPPHLLSAIRACLAKLKERDQQFIHGLYFEGMSHRELGERYGVKENHSKAIVFQSLERLRRCMKPNG